MNSRWISLLAGIFILTLCGCDNDRISPDDRVVTLTGPTAYKGIDGQMVMEGIVYNNSDRTLQNTMVIVSWYNKDKDFIMVMEDRLDKKPLYPKQSTNYRLEKEFDPRMNNYSIGFYNDKEELLSVYNFQYGVR